MPRYLFILLLVLVACGHSTPEPEPAAALEGTWQVRVVEPIEYDGQDNVLVVYQPTTPQAAGYATLRITGTELEYIDERGVTQSITPYTRTGAQLTCLPPERSYTLLNVGARTLDLHLRGQYIQSGPRYSRTDFTIRYDRR
ncbi:hypothetical protein [Hymenobacter psychrotolerans]|uniref:Lipocalin-like domain-containing protein n=1 Tax=Hymenobacter psychrotolerans DSM 18569 TaxID=1121959 RepID=A0A1M7GAV9_9BACT|nr:hypothetical protein [Hymenobacter psychrotolerans]SHM13514.1 hypothetical protein SAMN02746009_04000 [Hymenobacter psychrotolerans DSM 18569]